MRFKMTSEENSNKSISKVTTRQKFEETEEFHVLRPFCVAIVQNPTCNNLKEFQDALGHVSDPPQHLGEYVLFPFALHLKMLHKYKENLRISLFSCMADVVSKFEIRSWDMFIEMFQRIHLAVGTKEDPTIANTRIADDELEVIILCINSIVKVSLPKHFDMLFDDRKIQILAHSIFITLQVINLDTVKKIRLCAMEILGTYATACEGHQSASRRFFKFLPGIVNSLRKAITVKGGRVYQEIVVKGIQLLQKIITVCVTFEDESSLEHPDLSLSPVLSELSNDLVLHENVAFRTVVMKFSTGLLEIIKGKMRLCQEVLLNNLLVMRFDNDRNICCVISKHLSKVGSTSLKVNYDNILETANVAIAQLKGGNDRMCDLSLRKLSAYLTIVKFNFVESRGFLSVLFNLVTEVIRLNNSIVTNDKPFKSGGKVDLCARLCKAVIRVGNLDDILEEFDTVFSGFEGDVDSSFVGSVFCFNQILLAYVNFNAELVKTFREISEFEIMHFASVYLSMLDLQSTSSVLSILDSEAPRIQSVIDIRKAYLLEGLGIMGRICSNVLTVVLYPLVEYSGKTDSGLLSETANNSLVRLSEPKSMKDFLSEHLSQVMNELSVRILNLALHPNCPNALIFLAEYFDFRQTTFVKLVDQVLSRSCDPFCGGHLQLVYAKVFYSFILSLWKQKLPLNDFELEKANVSKFLTSKNRNKLSLMQRLLEYQKSIGMEPNVEHTESSKDMEDDEHTPDDSVVESETKALTSELNLVLKICHRVLNFLPSNERSVRLLGMDCLIKGISILRYHEDSLLPLAHTIWQNLIPRFSEKDYVVVRKSFELLLVLSTTCGSFLKKRILEEVFPKLSSTLTTLARESEQVKNKNRQYYTYTQAYKLQLTILQGMAELCDAIDIREDELDKIVDGCIVYLNPQQHKNLREASGKLIESLATRENSRSIWMKLISLGLRKVPQSTHPSFTLVPASFVRNINT